MYRNGRTKKMQTQISSPEQLIAYWERFQEAQQANDFPHRCSSLEQFYALFAHESDQLKKSVFLDEKTQGFLSASYDVQNSKHYINFIFVPEEFRRQGIGSKLLREYENYINSKVESPPIIELSFFNPVNLTWEVPGTLGHDHPNAPGIEMGSPGYYFFQNNGFRSFAYQNSYYLDLENYSVPETINALATRLAQEGITFEVYDKTTMDGMDALLEDLDSVLWTRDITFETSEEGKNRPIIVPLLNNTVYGFTGPLDVQESGRGYFAGIGVHSALRGRGVAKVLFSQLCYQLQKLGARYMTLFTGETNPARNIYEAAGFRIVKSWADMKKEIKNKR